MRYPGEVHSFIAENVLGRRTNDLASIVNERFNTEFTNSKMRSYMKNHKLKNGLPTRIKGECANLYSNEANEFISKNYIGTGHQEMADLLNSMFDTDYTKEQIKGYYARFKLDSGLSGQFIKGQKSWNKGKKGEYAEGCENTWFKKGHTPKNHREVGSERIGVDGYTEIKVAEPNKWRFKHVVVWEENNGKLPKGSCVLFGYGDKSNLDIKNLINITRSQLSVLNMHHLIQKDADLTRVGIVIADIKMKLNDRKRKSVRQ